MLTVVRWLLFAVAAVATASAAERMSRRATARGDLRFVATGGLTAAVAVAETLVLGIVRLGGNAGAIAAGAVLICVAVRLAVGPSGPSSMALAAAGWTRLGRPGRVLLGAAAGVVVAHTVFLIAKPAIGTDGLIYHLADPAIWVTGGRPGSMHAVVSGLPIQAYPKAGEVLFGWAIGTARTPIATTLIMMAALVVAGASAWSALRRLGVQQWIAVTVTTAVVGSPVMIAQVSGVNTDMLALSWVLCTGALCLGARSEPRLAPIALVVGSVAVGTKTTAIPIVVVALAITMWELRRDLVGQRVALLVSVAVTVGIGVVWYIQDLVVYHAPFYPFSRLPDGPRLPPVITALGGRFLSDPVGALRLGTAHGYAKALGGAGVLAVGVIVALVLLPAVRDRSLRRWIGLAAVGAVVETLIWGAAPFTGVPPHGASRALVLGGVRYLLPGFALFGLTAGLASRGGRIVRPVVAALAIAAVAADIWAQRGTPPAVRPPLVTTIGAALIGAVLAEIAGAVRRSPRSAPRIVAATGAVVAIAGLAAATPGYLGRFLPVARSLQLGDPALLVDLDHQPQWHSGHRPVAVGPVANALLAGPTFNHPLSVITETTSCATVRAAARAGWVILPNHVLAPAAPGARAYDRSSCMAGAAKTFSVDGLSVYGPGR